MDDAEQWREWWTDQSGRVLGGDVSGVVWDALRSGWLDLPLPGHGQTAERLLRLAWWGRADPVFARLAEGHADLRQSHAEADQAALGALARDESQPW